MSVSHAPSPSARIGLYGGAFDPVHRAHLALARCALDAAHLDRVVFLPAARSPLKERASAASALQRRRMLELAIAGEARFSVDPIELVRGGLSYTADTVDAYRARFPEADLFWILGADQFAQLDRWRDAPRLCRRLVFLVLARPGSDPSPPPLPGLRFQRVEAPLMEHSSTEIRRRRRRGLPIKGLVPDPVLLFIQEYRLYAPDTNER